MQGAALRVALQTTLLGEQLEIKAMKTGYSLAVAAVVGLLGGAPAIAHHSFVAEFDANAPIKYTGTVTKIEWRNPHTYFYVDVKGEDGQVHNWAMEMGSPNGLMRRGWTRNSLKVGDVISFEGWRARDGGFKGNTRAVTTADGTRLFANSSNSDDKSAK